MIRQLVIDLYDFWTHDFWRMLKEAFTPVPWFPRGYGPPEYDSMPPLTQTKAPRMISQLSIYERSACACPQCRQCCTGGKPGCLAPSDLDHLAEYLGLSEPAEEFIAKTFRACTDGPGTATESFPDGRTPAIRPKTREDGSCVFLGDEGQCTVHAVAPFECSRTLGCDPAAGAAAMKGLGKAIARSADYVQTWLWLREKQGDL